MNSITIRLGSVEDRPRRFAVVFDVQRAHERRFYIGMTEKGERLKFHETDIISANVMEAKPGPSGGA